MNIRSFILSFSLLFSLTGCFKREVKPSGFGLEFNEERKKIGLPMLDSTWRFDNITGNVIGDIWTNPNFKDGTPCYYTKVLVYQGDSILSESNRYLGPRMIHHIDATIQESLTISYYFAKNEQGIIGWDCTRKKSTSDSLSRFENYDIVHITKKQADSTLVAWGLK